VCICESAAFELSLYTISPLAVIGTFITDQHFGVGSCENISTTKKDGVVNFELLLPELLESSKAA
jgi:hypothetical protein